MTDNIPITIARALLPNRKDHIALSHIYTPLVPDQQNGPHLKYTIPFAANVTWTHLCPLWHGSSTPCYKVIYESSTTTNITTSFLPSTFDSGYYQAFTWPIPSLCFQNGTALTVHVDLPLAEATKPFNLKIVGFEDILPESAPQYILEDFPQPQWSFMKDESTQTYSLQSIHSQITTSDSLSSIVSIPKSSSLILSEFP